MKRVLFILLSIIYTFSYGQLAKSDTIQSSNGPIIIQPIQHASLILEWNDQVLYVDPSGDLELFKGFKAPTIILLTDIHGDHTSIQTLKSLNTERATLVAPPAVAELVKKDYEKQLVIVSNGGMSSVNGIFISAMPMYNLPETSDSKHPRGRGNGYFLNLGDKKIYISGDTEDIKEMRDLRRVDVAFVCMNLPYTMDINQAASAVLEFKPKIVYPYHYRGNPDMSDTEAFKKLVNSKNSSIEVRLKNWYPN
ncbi:MAG: MBL fold metallo-hydrolase [Flavobacteriaceae bacterium]|nr:MBL fold metallo-hydrolase [Flavobacteriaceae bacterium]